MFDKFEIWYGNFDICLKFFISLYRGRFNYSVYEQITSAPSFGTSFELMRRNFRQPRPVVFCTAEVRRYLFSFINHIFGIWRLQGLKWYIICQCTPSFNFRTLWVILGESPTKIEENFDFNQKLNVNKVWWKKVHTSKNWSLIKNPQFLSNV